MKKQLQFKNFLQTIMVVAIFGIGQLGFGQINITATGSAIQDFNTLAASGTTNPFVNNSTIPNWFSQRTGTGTNYAADAGTSTGGNLYSYGNGTNVDRALGTLGSGNAAAGNFAHGVLLRNTSGVAITNFTVSYTLEQWRKSGVTASQDITFYYQISSSAISNLTPNNNTSWIQVSALSLSSPVNTATGGALDGNNAANKVSLSNISIPSLTLANNEYIMLKWEDPDHTGSDHGLAIDDITVNWVVPAPPTLLTWTGTTNNLWSVASNWSPAIVPDGTIDVEINIGTPVLDVDFTVGNGKTLTVNGTGSLTVNPTRTLTVAGSATFNGRPITFKSDATGTGAFGAAVVPANVTGATNVTVERYLQGRRAVRFLTPAVTTTSTIFNNWQNGGNFVAGIGTHITGSTTIANGFDVTTTGNPSLFTYNAQVATGTGFTAISNTDVNVLTAGVGYRLLVRGDRTPENITTASQDNMNVPTTLSATGALTVGSVTYTSAVGPALVNNQAGNTQTNGYTLIGNPYASPVDWHSISKNNVAGNAYYTWDPTLGTPAQRGRYVVYSQLGGASLFDDSSAQPLNNRQFLQVGQAFFIKNEPGQSATLVFDETNKASTYQYVYRNSQAALTSNNSSLYLSVYDPNELALGGNAIDGAAAVFGTDYATTLDNNDVEKLVASGENVAFVRENKNLAIETVAPVQANDVLFVKTIAFQANKNYTFKVNTTNFNTTVAAKMVDMYLNTETAIDLTQPSFVTFSTTADAASFGSDRFKIVFNSAALGNDNFTRNTIAVYPNPIVNNEFTVAMPSSVTGKVTLTITNMLGQQVYKTTTEATPTMQIQPMQKLQEGIYVVSVNSNGNVTQAKVTVKN